MSKYTREELMTMDEDELAVAYEEVLQKSVPSTRKRPLIVKDILDAQAEEEEEEEEPIEKKQRSAPVTQVRSTLMKAKTPPKSAVSSVSALKKKSPQVVLTVDPQVISLGQVQEEVEDEVSKPKRGRPPKKVEKISLSSSSEEVIQQYEPPAKSAVPEKVDSILERIKKTAKVSLLNPKASFQRGDVVREREPEKITPVVVSEANLVSIQLPVHEEAKKSITDFLHEVGFGEEIETVPSPRKSVSPKTSRKSAVTVDEELERLAKRSQVEPEEEEPEEEYFTLGEPERVSVVESIEPSVEKEIRVQTQEPGIRKSIKDILEEQQATQLEEDLQFAKEQEEIAEKERELEKKTLEEEKTRKKLSRRPVVVRSVTEEGEESAVEPQPEPAEKLDEQEEEFKKTVLRSPEKWIGVPLDDIPFSEMKKSPKKRTQKVLSVAEEPVATEPVAQSVKAKAKSIAEIVEEKRATKKPSSKKKEKVEEIITEVEEPEPLVVKKTVRKTVIEPTERGEKEIVRSVREVEEPIELEEEERVSTKPSKPSSKPSSKKKKAETETVDVLAILQQVDTSRLGSGRGKNLYNLTQIQDILRQLPNVKKTTGKKEELVGILEAELTKYGLM